MQGKPKERFPEYSHSDFHKYHVLLSFQRPLDVDENDEVPCVWKAAANINVIVPKAGTIIMAKLAPRHRERSSEVANMAEF